MAIVSKEQIYFMGESFHRVVRVLRDGSFRIKYPDVIRETTGVDDAVADTLSEVFRIFSEELQRYKDSETTTKKVILYDIQDDISFSHGVALAIAASVAIESKFEYEGNITYRYDSVKSEDDLPFSIRSFGHLNATYGKQATNAIDWTPERHQFFTRMCTAMLELKGKLSDLGKDRENLLKYADDGLFLIAG